MERSGKRTSLSVVSPATASAVAASLRLAARRSAIRRARSDLSELPRLTRAQHCDTVLAMSAAVETLRRAAGRRPLTLVAMGVFLYSTGPVMVQASSVSGPVFSFWRLWFGVGIFGIATLIHTRRRGLPSVEGWRWSVKAGVAFGIHQLLFMIALKATSVVDVTLIGTLQPVVVGVIAVYMFGERPGIRFRAWSVAAMAGAAIIVLAGSTGPEGNPEGMALATVNVVFFSLFFVWSKAGRDHIPVVPFLFGVMAVAAVLVSAFVAVTGESPSTADRTDLLLALSVAAIPGAIGHLLVTWPLRWVPANLPPLIKLGGPVIAGGLAWIFLGESAGPAVLVGGAVTLAGVAGALSSPAGRRMAASAELDPSGVDA